jgi:ADP-heptose:LPS heptosyltransferase
MNNGYKPYKTMTNFRSNQINNQAPKKFLLCAHTGLGNFVLKTPLIRAIHENFEDATIDLLCAAKYGADKVLLGSSWVRKIYIHDKPSLVAAWKIVKRLRAERYDVLLCPFDSTPRYIRLALEMLGAKKIISHFNALPPSRRHNFFTGLKFLLRRRITFIQVLAGRHETDLNLDLLEPLLRLPQQRNTQTFVHFIPEDLSLFYLPESYIVIQPAARNGQPTPKTWDPKNFDQLIKKWQSEHPEDVFVLVGDVGDEHSLRNTIGTNKGILNLLGKTSFNQLCNVLSRAKLVITHDSGAMHVANALQRPLLALYGPTDFTRTRPLAPTSNVLHSKTSCWALMYAFSENENSLDRRFPGYRCMSGITVEQVFSSMKDVLKANE